MANRLSKITEYLSLREVGLLEMSFALTPMMSGFGLGSLPMSLLMWVWLVALVILQGKMGKIQLYKPLLCFVLYWLLHQLLIMVIDDLNLNGFLAQMICFIAAFSLYPILNLQKLRGSLNWVAIISMLGLLFQWTQIARGTMVHPLEIPGLTRSDFLLEKMSFRPSSFFNEPAAYVAFMICPLLFALIEKKYTWAVGIILSVFLTTSTTGLFVSFIMLCVSVAVDRKIKISNIIIIALIGGGLLLAFTHLDMFSVGLSKLEDTDASSNIRLTQGQYVVGTMNSNEFIFGVPYSTAYNYCIAGRAPDAVFYGETVYMPTFWQILLLFGIVGLVLYINVYIQILKHCRTTLPLIVALFAVMFSSSYALGVSYFSTLIVLLVILKNYSSSPQKIIKY